MSSANILVVGDVHIGKKFNTYKPNPYNQSEYTNLSQLWTPLTLSYIEETIKSQITNLDMVIFLGDIFDKPALKPEYAHQFTKLLQGIQSWKSDVEVHIVVGNHDTTEPLNPYGTYLSTYNGWNNVYVHISPTYIQQLNFLMFPYMKREQLSEQLAEWSNRIQRSDVSIFSHNDFYINDTFIMTEMLNVEILKDMFGIDCKIFNGHIHNYYYESTEGIFFTGSVSPTSFKDSPMSSGICKVTYSDIGQITDFQTFKNTKIVFITIDNQNYIDQLEKYLAKCREHNIQVVLRFSHKLSKLMETILNRYSDIIPFFKDYIHADEIQPTQSTNTESTDISVIKEKVGVLVESGYSKDEIVELFIKYIGEKYGYDESDIKQIVNKQT